jgi:hypothetical protein
MNKGGCPKKAASLLSINQRLKMGLLIYFTSGYLAVVSGNSGNEGALSICYPHPIRRGVDLSIFCLLSTRVGGSAAVFYNNFANLTHILS